MSKLKIRNWYTFILIALLSMFLVGCENEVKVDGISFNLGEESQLVLVVGQELDLNTIIEIEPGYATNKEYTLTSSDTNVVAINGSVITAVEQGQSVLRVVSKENSKKEDIMTVLVRESVEVLDIPTNLQYDADLNAFTFGIVEKASSYTININGEDYSVGNTNIFPLSRYVGKSEGEVLTAKVRAEAPKYSYAYESSVYSEEYKCYQAEPVTNVKIVGGQLSFNSGAVNNVITINNEEYATTNKKTVSILDLEEKYAGEKVSVGVNAVIDEATIKDMYGDDVHCFNSQPVSVDVSVLNSIDLDFVFGVINWKAMAGVAGYKLYVGEENVVANDGIITDTYFDLNSLSNIDTVITVDSVKEIRVKPVLDSASENVTTSQKMSSVSVSRLDRPMLALGENSVVWNNVENAQSYVLTIQEGSEDAKVFNTASRSLSLVGYGDDGDINISLKAESAQLVNGIYYLSSSESKLAISKNKNVPLEIEDYKLKFDSVIGDEYRISFLTVEGEENIKFIATEGNAEIDLISYNFAVGEQIIRLLHVGNGRNTINSGESDIRFTQLEPIDSITIADGKASVIKSELNDKAIVELKTTIGGEIKTVRATEWQYNTTDSSAELFLPSGDYTTSVYVLGDGSTTFGHRVNGEFVPSSTVDFTVLDKPVIDGFNKENGNITYLTPLNAQKYDLYKMVDGEFVFDREYESAEAITVRSMLNGGESSKYKLQAKGDGSEYLDSVISDVTEIYKLTQPIANYDNQTNTFSAENDINSIDMEIKQGNSVRESLNNIELTNGPNKIIFKSIAKDAEGNKYYINSDETEVNVYKISNSVTYTFESDALKISHRDSRKPFDINIEFSFANESEEYSDYVQFSVDEGYLKAEGYPSLPISLDQGNYMIGLVDENFDPIIADMLNGFKCRVSFLAPINDNTIANSDLAEEFVGKLSIIEKPVLSRVDQTIVFKNVNENYRLNNYTLVVGTDEYPINNIARVDGENIVIDAQKLFDTVGTDDRIDIVIKVGSTQGSDFAISTYSAPIAVRRNAPLDVQFLKDNSAGDKAGYISIDLSNQSTEYSKEYILSLQESIYKYSEMIGGSYRQEIVINTDTIDPSFVSGRVAVTAVVETSDEYMDGEDVVYVFNSSTTRIEFNKLQSVTNVYVSNNTLYFNKVAGSIGYEVCTYDGAVYNPLQTELIPNDSNIISMELTESNYSGLVIRAIADENNINSDYSASIDIQRAQGLNFVVDNGHFSTTLDNSLVELINEEKATLSLYVNDQKINLKALDSSLAMLVGNTLTVYADQILKYEYDALTLEDVRFELIVEYSAPVDNTIYYLNPIPYESAYYGLFSPKNVRKSADTENDSVDFITWESNEKNTLNDESIEQGYIFKIIYFDGASEYEYVSNDSSMKYKVGESYYDYGIITNTKARFPYGIDENNDGNFEVVFGAGDYNISVQAIAIDDNDEICASKFCSEYTMTIMQTPILEATNGYIQWAECVGATAYKVTITQGTKVVTDEVTTNEYHFTDTDLNTMAGVCNVEVKAISTRLNVINSQVSDPIAVYRLPVVTEASIDDGMIRFTADKYFKNAQIILTDRITKKDQYIDFNNEEKADGALNLIAEKDWSKVTPNGTYNLSAPIGYLLGDEKLKDLNARSYSMKIVLDGCTFEKYPNLPLITSEQSEEFDILIEKLRPTVHTVTTGVFKYGVATEHNDNYMNYQFGSDDDFFANTFIYRLEIKTQNADYTIYTVDYDSFVNAVSLGTLVNDDVDLSNDDYDSYVEGGKSKNGLYAMVKYKLGTETLYLNVYENNIIDLATIDKLYYHEITRTITDAEISYASNPLLSEIDIAGGGQFFLDIYLLGGDQYPTTYTNEDGETINTNLGYITSKDLDLRPFIRYGTNNLSTQDGLVRFDNLLLFDLDDETKEVDFPVYRLEYGPINEGMEGIIYCYPQYEVSDELKVKYFKDLDKIKLKNDSERDVEYVILPLKKDDTYLTFDLSTYLDSSKNYNVVIKTLVGLGGTGEGYDYLLNSKSSNENYFKYSSPEVIVNAEGLLQFDMSYVLISSEKSYANYYELTLIDNNSHEETVIAFDRTSNTPGIVFDDVNHVVKYNLPSTYSSNSYSIKVRGLSKENRILNGTYLDTAFSFSRVAMAQEIRIEEGQLRWVVLDPSAVNSAYIKMTYLDGEDTVEIIFRENGTRVNNPSGQYLYHYYSFLDSQYEIGSTSWKEFISAGIDYTLSMMMIGDPSNNVIHSGYSNGFVVNRLETVSGMTTITPMIDDADGILTWNEVDFAESYLVTIAGDEHYEFNTVEPILDLTGMIEPGVYNITIRAIGGNRITAMASDTISGFRMLEKVENIEINDFYTFTWNTVEYANKYKVSFEYTDLQGNLITKDQTEQIVDTNTIDAPEDIGGLFTIYVQAVGQDEDKKLNGEVSSLTSTKEVPRPVGEIKYDSINNRYYWSINTNNVDTDEFHIRYSVASYTESGIASAENKEVKIKMTDDNFYTVDEVTYCYLPLTVMGQYSNFMIYVYRPGTVASAVTEGPDVDLNLYKYGDGSVVNPYAISNIQELLNIKYYANNKVNFKLVSSIDLDNIYNVDNFTSIEEILANNYAENYTGLISSKFNGTLDGQGFNIYATTIELHDVESFALFGYLDNATIKNVNFGTENEKITMTLSNSFANQVENVVQLSLIATGAKNSIIENVDVYNLVISVDGVDFANDLYLAGMIINDEGSTITNTSDKSTVSVSIDIQSNLSGYSYLGGLISNAKNTDIDSQDVNFTLSAKADIVCTYVGGIIGYYEGQTSVNVGVSDSNVNMSISNIDIQYLGGVVGLGKYMLIENNTISGNITLDDLYSASFTGGVAGSVKSAIIRTNVIEIGINVTIKTTTVIQKLGAVVGVATKDSAVNCIISNNTVASAVSLGKTQITTEESGKVIRLGLYGEADNYVTIQNNNQK